ncbi:hypothetical protein N3K66_006625 [Trichothecium roseum]|uniref:Uncharacterized protein n=1 Tax=Trichothecium roseum TaxID=47278 RepID=A0ACC0UVT5_9HYPO|nr:hypothetical protein N3K66_006625 [Trichothecium roseum]
MASEEEKKATLAYEHLEALEDESEDIELELLRHQYKISKEHYAKREKVVAEIPQFWGQVLEAAPPDIDEYIQPTDAALLAGHLTNISVDRFELPDGDPRSIAVKFEFSENEHFTNKVLEKKFYWRRAKDTWEGHISTPTKIDWKGADKDLTNGMLDLAIRVHEDEARGTKPEEQTEAKKELKAKMESTGIDGLSFFAFFGFRGRQISDEEHAEATKIENERRQRRKEGKKVEEDDDMDEDEDENDEYEWEIFPTADDLAVTIAEELYPNAIKYFLTAQEQDALSDLDFEDDDEDESDEEMGGSDEPNKKKRKA